MGQIERGFLGGGGILQLQTAGAMVLSFGQLTKTAIGGAQKVVPRILLAERRDRGQAADDDVSPSSTCNNAKAAL